MPPKPMDEKKPNLITLMALSMAGELIKNLPKGSQSNKYEPDKCENTKAKQRRLKQMARKP